MLSLRWSRPVTSSRFADVAGQRLGERIVLEEAAEAALAGVDTPRDLLQVGERGVQALVGRRILEQAAERAPSVAQVRRHALRGGHERGDLLVELVVAEQLADRALAAADVLQHRGDLLERLPGAVGDVGQLSRARARQECSRRP